MLSENHEMNILKYRYTIRTDSINYDTVTQSRYTQLFKLKLIIG